MRRWHRIGLVVAGVLLVVGKVVPAVLAADGGTDSRPDQHGWFTVPPSDPEPDPGEVPARRPERGPAGPAPSNLPDCPETPATDLPTATVPPSSGGTYVACLYPIPPREDPP